VVDRHAGSRQLLSRALATIGFEPIEAEGPGDALEALAAAHEAGRPARVAILDVESPDSGGMALVQALRRDARFAELPCLLLAARHRPKGEALRRAGAAVVVARPALPSSLARAFAELDGRPAAPTSSVPAAAARRRLRVLVAEDNETNALVARRLLEKQGHEVKVVANGSLAVEACADATYDVVFMDVQMPVMDGYEASRRIREREAAAGAHTPIVALTANAMSGDDARCSEAGMDGYLSKPIDPRRLRKLLDEIVSRAPAR
jgi:CheY-like chemotaxis protein